MSAVRYEHVHHFRFDPGRARSLDELVAMFEANLETLRRWKSKGIELDPHGVGSNYAIFYTYDQQVAQEEGFERLRTEAGNPLPRR